MEMFFLFNKKQEKPDRRAKVYVYVDGSYREGMYSGAYLVYRGTRCIHKDSGIGTKAASMCNVAGELSAVMHAALWLHRNNYRGILVYDYRGIEDWITEAWQCKNVYTQQYKAYMKKFVDNGTVEFKWVKGHSGDLGNAQADKLAREALKKRRKWKTYFG